MNKLNLKPKHYFLSFSFLIIALFVISCGGGGGGIISGGNENNTLTGIIPINDVKTAIEKTGANWTPGETIVSQAIKSGALAKNFLGFDDIILENITITPTTSVSNIKSPSYASLPSKLDWRDYKGGNWMSEVKNQGDYGTCVAHATAAALETHIKIKMNMPFYNVDLSELHFFALGGGSFSNGWWYNGTTVDGRKGALDYLLNNGTVLESFCPYSNAPNHNEVLCKSASKIKISNLTMLTNQGAESIKNALINGPVLTAMVVYEDFLYYYNNGIYSYSSGQKAGGHAVLFVGWDDTANPPCWIVKNSWSSNWGENGYFRIKYGECGIETRSVYSIEMNNVTTPNLDSISLSSNTFFIKQGGTLKLSSISTTASYKTFLNDYTSKTVTPTWSVKSGNGYINSGIYYPQANQSTPAILTATYQENGITRISDLTVNFLATLTSLSLSINTDNINAGSNYNISKIIATAFYSNGTSKQINPKWLTNDGLISGDLFFPHEDLAVANLMASYIEEGISQTAKFTLDINPILKSISINKTIDYISESSYDLSKISTTAIYSNKTSKTIKPTWIVVSGGGNINGEIFTPLTGSSNYILTASYTDNQIVKTATLTLSVKPLVASISLSKTTDTLFCGYSYDLSLITPVITYSNNTTNNLIKLASSSWAIKSGSGTLSGLNYTAPSTPGTTVLTASYTEDQVTKSADLTITILPLSSRTIVITQQPPSSVIAGATIAPSVIVKICDNSGNVVASDNSTQITATALTPALSQASGNLSNATVTFNAGYATFNGLKYDKAENIILKFSVVGLASLQSNGILISPGALDHFSITSNSPQTANNQIRLTVTAKDSFDNLITDYKSAGTLTIEETTGAITWGGTGITDGTDPGGTYAGSSFSSGIAEITITNTASDSDKSIVVTDTATGKSGTSKVSWNPGALHHFTIASLTGQTAGTAFPVTITAKDANDNIVTEFISTVALSDFTATLTPANTGNFVKGSWIGNITITKALTGNKITVTSSKTGFSNEFTVSAGTASKLAMAIDPPATIKAGENFGSQMKINICDAFGNVVSSNSHSQVTASIGSSGTVPLNGTLTITASNGVASFANLSYSKAEPIKIRFYSGSLTPVETNTITVLPGAISSYIVSSSSPQTAGTGFSGTITAKDQFGNIVLNDSATVINLTSNGSGTFYTSSNYGVTTTCYTLNSGVANYFVKDTKAEVIAISAKDNNLISGSSASITVSPLPASKLILA